MQDGESVNRTASPKSRGLGPGPAESPGELGDFTRTHTSLAP